MGSYVCRTECELQSVTTCSTVEGDRGQENRGREGYGRQEKKVWKAKSLRGREAGEKAFVIYYCLLSSQKHTASNIF